MSCVHAGDHRNDRTLCRHFGEWLSPTRCTGCPAFVAGVAVPETYADIPADPPPPSTSCMHLGESLTDEPCSCGSATRISIHACHSQERTQSRRDHAFCVPLATNWNRLADPDAARSAQCCETCPLRTPPISPKIV